MALPVLGYADDVTKGQGAQTQCEMRIFSKIFRLLGLISSKISKHQIWRRIWQKLLVSPTSINVDWEALTDRFIDPIIWVVDNFSDSLGVAFVIFVWLLITFIVGVAYWIGLPYYWELHKGLATALVILGNWILVNVLFHYYMALITPPGHPPDIEQIPQISARCKKCHSAKPPRTHHCSICKTCILRMDHHCPWLNNCVGHFNHRYFFLFMAYVVLGMIFLYIFGAPVLYHELYGSEDSEPIGYRVFNNGSHILPLEDEDSPPPPKPKSWRRAAVVVVGILCTGILLALGSLLAWHARLIHRGETSIENLTNKEDRRRSQDEGRAFVNPYDYGPRENWRIFFGLAEGRSWLCVYFPSVHPPRGDGINWNFKQR